MRPARYQTILLSSTGSLVGGTVLAAAVRADLKVDLVIVERVARHARFARAAKYAKRYGLAAIGCRLLEFGIYRALSKRANKGTTPPVEEVASSFGIRVVEVGKLNSAAALEQIVRASPEIGLLGGAPIVSSAVVASFRLGLFGSHAGVLPGYRGNYANRWALLQGDATGFTVYRVDCGIDTGPILRVELIRKDANESICAFEERIGAIAAAALPGILVDWLEGGRVEFAQDPEKGKIYGLMQMRKVLALYWRCFRRNL